MILSRAALLFTLILLQAATGSATAQEAWPTRPITIVVGFTPGGGSDTVARALAPAMSMELKVPVIVDNRPGAGGVIGTDFVAKAKPDGYTLLLASPGAFTIVGSLRKLPYDPVKDFTPIAQLTSYANILVATTASGITSVADLIKRAKAQPGKLDFASSGSGTTPHLAFAYLNMLTGMDIQHVPYKGTPPAMADVLSGQIPLMIGDPPPLLPHVEAGKLRALAVTTKNRSKLFPNIPSMAEAGVPNFDVAFWHALTGPPGLPPEIAGRLEDLVARLLARKDIVEKIEAGGMGVEFKTPRQLTASMAAERARWAEVIRVNNIKE